MMNKKLLCLIFSCLLVGNFIDANAMQGKLTTLKQKLESLKAKLGGLKNSLGELKKKLGTSSGGASKEITDAIAAFKKGDLSNFEALMQKGEGFVEAIKAVLGNDKTSIRVPLAAKVSEKLKAIADNMKLKTIGSSILDEIQGANKDNLKSVVTHVTGICEIFVDANILADKVPEIVLSIFNKSDDVSDKKNCTTLFIKMLGNGNGLQQALEAATTGIKDEKMSSSDRALNAESLKLFDRLATEWSTGENAEKIKTKIDEVLPFLSKVNNKKLLTAIKNKVSGSVAPLKLADQETFNAAKAALINAKFPDTDTVIAKYFTPLFDQGIGLQAIEFAQSSDLWDSAATIAQGNALFMELAVYGQGIDQAIPFVKKRNDGVAAPQLENAKKWGVSLLEGLASIAASVEMLGKVRDAFEDAEPAKKRLIDALENINTDIQSKLLIAPVDGFAVVVVAQKAFEYLKSNDVNKVTDGVDLFSKVVGNSFNAIGLLYAGQDFIYKPQIIRCILQKVLKLETKQISEISPKILELCTFLINQLNVVNSKEAPQAVAKVFEAQEYNLKTGNAKRIESLDLLMTLLKKNYLPEDALKIASLAVSYSAADDSGTGGKRTNEMLGQGLNLFRELKKMRPQETITAVNNLLQEGKFNKILKGDLELLVVDELAEIKKMIAEQKGKADPQIGNIISAIKDLYKPGKYGDAIEAIVEYIKAGNWQNQASHLIVNLRMTIQNLADAEKINACRLIVQKTKDIKAFDVLNISSLVVFCCLQLVRRYQEFDMVAETAFQVFLAQGLIANIEIRMSCVTIVEELIDRDYKDVGKALEVAKQAVLYVDPTGPVNDSAINKEGAKLFIKLKDKFPNETTTAIKAIINSNPEKKFLLGSILTS